MATKRRRKHAEDRALEILKQNRAVTDQDLLEVLTHWRFHKNKARQNVLPEGEESVFSDTLGLVKDRATKQRARARAFGANAAQRRGLEQRRRQRRSGQGQQGEVDEPLAATSQPT